jgi:phosphotransferase system enzyme I (PtsP)
MAEPIEPQERLDQIVRQIAANMVAEVCSAYVLRADGVLELFATEGLNKDAVHLAQLKMGQGLVGTIAASARSLNLSDAQSHPAFDLSAGNRRRGLQLLPRRADPAGRPHAGRSRRPEQGAPEVWRGRGRGARNHLDGVRRDDRHRRAQADHPAGLELDLTRPVTIEGTPTADGIGLGHVILHEPRIVVTELLNDDIDAEFERLEEALGSLRISIDDMLSRRDVSMEGEHRAVLEAYRMFAHDRGWVRKLEEAIRNGLTCEAAVEKVQSDTRARMIHMTDPYLRERLHDFDDLANRLLRQLTGFVPGGSGLPQDAIIVARAMGAAELLDYPRDSRACSRRRRGYQPCGDRCPRHGHSRGRPGPGHRRAGGKPPTRSSSTARMARSSAPAADVECLCGQGEVPRPRQEEYRDLRDKPSNRAPGTASM